MMIKLKRIFLSSVMALAIPLFLAACDQEASQSQSEVAPEIVEAAQCTEINLEIGRANSVHGKKEGKLFGYVDLAENAENLFCHEDSDIDIAVKSAVEKAVNEWWEKDRFTDLAQAEIHIITITDKDEYARADFNAAKQHGVLKLTKNESGEIAAEPSELDFSNMRQENIQVVLREQFVFDYYHRQLVCLFPFT